MNARSRIDSLPEDRIYQWCVTVAEYESDIWVMDLEW